MGSSEPLAEKFDALSEMEKSLQASDKEILLGGLQEKLENQMMTRVIPQCRTQVLQTLSSSILIKMYRFGGMKSMSKAFETLRLLIRAKDLSACIGPLYCIGALAEEFGRSFVAVYFSDVASVILKVAKTAKITYSSTAFKQVALVSLTRMLRVTQHEDLTEPIKFICRMFNESSHGIKLGCGPCMAAIMAHSPDAKQFDILFPLISKFFSDLDTDIRHSFALATGQMLAELISREKAHRQMRHYTVNNLEDAVHLVGDIFKRSNNPTERTTLADILVSILDEQPDNFSDTYIESVVNMLMTLLRSSTATSTDPSSRQSARCIGFALRNGLLCRLKGRQLHRSAIFLLSYLKQHIGDASSVTDAQMFCCLQELSFIFQNIGPSVEMEQATSKENDMKMVAIESLLPLFGDAKGWIRIYAAQCFRQLARSAPYSASDWIRTIYSVFKIRLAEMDPNMGIVDVVEDQATALETIRSLNGHVHALAALIGIVPELPHGIPLGLLNDVYDGTLMLFEIDFGDPGAVDHEPRRSLREAAWLLLGAVISLGLHSSSDHFKRLFTLWKDCLANEVSDPPAGFKWSREVRIRTQALLALRSYSRNLPSASKNHMSKLVYRAYKFALGLKNVRVDRNIIFNLHSAIFDVFYELPFKHADIIVGCINTFVHSHADRTSELESIFMETDNPLSQFVVSSNSASADSQYDSRTVPYSSGVDLLCPSRVEQLQDCFKESSYTECFTLRWLNFVRPTAHVAFEGIHMPPSERELLGLDEVHPSVRVINSAVRLFGALYVHQTEKLKVQIIREFAIKIKDSEAKGPGLDEHMIENIAAALLVLCARLCDTGETLLCPMASEAILQVLSLLLACQRPSVQRAASMTFGLIAKCEGGDIAGKAQTLLSEQLRSKDLHTVAASFFGLGCLMRYVPSSRADVLPFTIANMQPFTREFDDPFFRTWLLHCNFLCISHGGPELSNFLRPLVNVLYGHLLHDHSARSSPVSVSLFNCTEALIELFATQFMGNLQSAESNNVVDSDTKSAFRSAVSILYCLSSSSMSEAARVPALRSILMLLAQLPQYVRTDDAMDLVLNGLGSSNFSIQRAALDCLLVWVERDLTIVSKYNLETRVLNLLDDLQSHVSHEMVKETYGKLILRLVPLEPSKEVPNYLLRFVDACKRVLSGSHRLPSDQQNDADAKAKEDDVEDDEGFVQHDNNANEQKRNDPHIGTKVFAGECLVSLLHLVHSSESRSKVEFHLHHSKKHGASKNGRKYLVQQLNDLVTVACMAASTHFNRMRACGVKLLEKIVSCFALSEDPFGHVDEDDPDSLRRKLLLTQYEAQVNSTLRQCLKSDLTDASVSPDMRTAACHAASAVLQSGILYDPSRLFKMLVAILSDTGSLSTWGMVVYDRRAAVQVILSHIGALANLHAYALRAGPPSSSSKKRKGKKKNIGDFVAERLLGLIGPVVPVLVDAYTKATKDLMVVITQSRKSLTTIEGNYFKGKECTKIKSVFVGEWFYSIIPLALLLKESSASSLDKIHKDVVLDEKLPIYLLAAASYGLRTGFRSIALEDGALSEAIDDLEDACLTSIDAALSTPYNVEAGITIGALLDLAQLLRMLVLQLSDVHSELEETQTKLESGALSLLDKVYDIFVSLLSKAVGVCAASPDDEMAAASTDLKVADGPPATRLSLLKHITETILNPLLYLAPSMQTSIADRQSYDEVVSTPLHLSSLQHKVLSRSLDLVAPLLNTIKSVRRNTDGQDIEHLLVSVSHAVLRVARSVGPNDGNAVAAAFEAIVSTSVDLPSLDSEFAVGLISSVSGPLSDLVHSGAATAALAPRSPDASEAGEVESEALTPLVCIEESRVGALLSGVLCSTHLLEKDDDAVDEVTRSNPFAFLAYFLKADNAYRTAAVSAFERSLTFSRTHNSAPDSVLVLGLKQCVPLVVNVLENPFGARDCQLAMGSTVSILACLPLAEHKLAFVSLIVPRLMVHLQHSNPACVSMALQIVLKLAASFGEPFKAIMASVPAHLRTALQTAAQTASMQAAAQPAPSSSKTSHSSRADKEESASTKKKAKKAKKKKEKKKHEVQEERSIDFSKFGK